ncbi:MAG TPA: pentapeptide repeat-containing protein [Candidatus Rubrimentiphilum sp.]|nr:pentapeptide repeat-containing protein [Candidatus Rubrimentiphilum sp.]
MQALMVVVATLFNSLWVGALLALATWALLNYLPNINATTRYAAWCIALAASLLVPLATAFPQISLQRAPAQQQSASSAVTAPHLQKTPAHKVTALAQKSNGVVAQPAAPPALRLPSRAHFALPAPVAVTIFSAWVAIALFLLIRLAVSLYRLEALKRDALPLSLDYREHLARWTRAEKGGRDVRLCVSGHIEVPVAVGLFDSMVLIPKHLLDRLSEKEIDQITLHELAHLRRADDWTNGFQRVIQAIFFFNPAILFMAQQLDLEREVACDDWVLHETGDVRPYATCLTRMAEVTAWPHRALAAPGVFVTRRGLSIRVERLLRAGRNVRTSVSFGPAGAVAAALIVLFFIAQNVAPSFAFTLPSTTAPSPATRVTHGTAAAAQAKLQPATKEKVVYLPGKDTVRTIVAEAPTPVPKQKTTPGTKTTTTTSVKTRTVRRRVWVDNSFKDIDVNVPDVHVNVPAVHVNVPAVDVNVPATTVRVPAVHVQVPAVNVNVPGYSYKYKVPVGYVNRLKRLDGLNNNGSCTGCDFSSVKWAGRNLSHVALVGSDFSNADLHGANFSYANLTGVDFKNANLRDVNFSNANLQGCDMRSADLTGAIFTGAHINGCDISVANLAPAQARAILTGCEGCDFKNANLRGQDLRGIAVTGDDFAYADLRGADMRNSSFNGVDFRHARFDGARLDGASFNGCDFSGVDLRNVDLSHTQIVGSKIDIMR